MKAADEIWAGFWQNEPSASKGATLANLPPALQQQLDAPWRDLARLLPAKAKVLDLATGGGIVLELLSRQRRDLNLLGVDSASDLPKRSGMALRENVSTEDLPFPDGRFDVVTSRFGIEYGDLEAGASEAGRVLNSGGWICLLIHNDESNVVGHNRARRHALHWAAKESGWVEKALSVANARRTFRLPTPPAFGAAPNDAAVRFPEQSAAWEFLTGLHQLLVSGASELQISALVRQANSELARIDALLTAACDATRIARLTQALTGAGMILEPTRTVDEPSGVPLAWHLRGRKS